MEERGLQVFSMRDADDPLREVDLFAVEPIPFAELVRDADRLTVGDVEVPVVSRDHLITMKRRAGRPIDLPTSQRSRNSTGSTMTEDGDGSFEADRRAKLEAWSQGTPTQLLAWLEEALLLAEASGALARDRARRQRDTEELWER